MSIIVGSVIGLVAAAGIAFAVTILGGLVTGSIQSNGTQPDLQWVTGSGQASDLQFSGCVDADGNPDSTATGSALPSSDSQTLDITLTNVWDNETCTFTGYVQNTGGAAVNINGFALTDASGNPITAALQEPSTTPSTVAPGDEQFIEFTVTVPADGTPVTTDITGGLELSLASNTVTYNPGNGVAT